MFEPDDLHVLAPELSPFAAFAALCMSAMIDAYRVPAAMMTALHQPLAPSPACYKKDSAA